MLYVIRPTTQSAVRKWLDTHATRIVITIAGLYGLILFYLAYAVRLRNGMGIVIDVALIEQILWATGKGYLFLSSHYNGNFLSGHFPPLLLPLSLLYRFLPDIGVIFAVKIGLISAAGVLLYYFCREATDSLTGLVVALGFMLSPAIVSQHFGLYLNHLVPFFWIGAAFAFWRRRFLLFVVMSVLAASVQEDIALSLIGFAPLAFLEKRTSRWRMFASIFPVAWVIVAMLVMQSSAAATGITLGGHFSQLGQTPAEVATRVIQNPAIILNQYLDQGQSKLLWAYELLAPFLFVLPFFTFAFLGALPDWAVFASIPLSGDQYSVAWYYSHFIVTVLFTASVYSLSRLRKWNPALPGVVGVIILMSNLAMLPLSLSPDLFKTDGGARMRTLQAIRAQIPDTACVTTTYDIAQPFAQRMQLYALDIAPETKTLACDYIISSLDVENRPDSSGLRRLLARMRALGLHKVLLEENGIRVWGRISAVHIILANQWYPPEFR
jgi:uncharacterized membrane protein